LKVKFQGWQPLNETNGYGYTKIQILLVIFSLSKLVMLSLSKHSR
jgi:hypothetical protein